MEKEEIVSSAMNKMEKKKCYTAPKVEAIASVREMTKGAIGAGTDAAGHVPVPSDPGGF